MPITGHAILPRLALCLLALGSLVAVEPSGEIADFVGGPEKVVILGDSITFAGGWPTLVESGLRATPAFADAAIVNLGVPSETASGLSEPGHAGGKFPRPCVLGRIDRVLANCKPTIVLACYGMNDGIYRPLDEQRTAAFRDGMTKLRAAVVATKARFIAITPTLFSVDHPETDNQHYDAVLDAYAAWLVAQRAAGWEVVDMRPDLRAAVAAEKQKQPEFVFAKDRVHPGDRGHELAAAAVWSGLAPVLKLSAEPHFAQGPALAKLRQRAELLKLAWLGLTGHERPGIAPGEPVAKANPKAAELLAAYRTALATGH